MAVVRTCGTCGFLALRNRFTGVLDEAPKDYREEGRTPQLRNQGVVTTTNPEFSLPYRGDPVCFVQAYRLIDEVAWTEGTVTDVAVLSIMNKPRTCDDLFLSPSSNKIFPSSALTKPTSM